MARSFAKYGNISFACWVAVWANGGMSEKIRTTIYLRQKTREKGNLLMEERELDENLTAFIELLMREEWERRATPQMDAKLTALMAMQQQPIKPTPEAPAAVRKKKSSGKG